MTASDSSTSSPLVGSSSSSKRTGRQEGAGHGEAPPLSARERDAVAADGRVETGGQRGDEAVELGDAQRVVDGVVAGVGPAQGQVGPQRPGEELRPLVGERAGAAHVALGATATRRCRRSESVPRSSGQNRRSALTRLDLPAPLEPVTARCASGGQRQADPVEGAREGLGVAQATRRRT